MQAVNSEPQEELFDNGWQVISTANIDAAEARFGTVSLAFERFRYLVFDSCFEPLHFLASDVIIPLIFLVYSKVEMLELCILVNCHANYRFPSVLSNILSGKRHIRWKLRRKVFPRLIKD